MYFLLRTCRLSSMCRIAFLFLVSVVLARPDTIQAQSFGSATWILEARDVVSNFGLDADASGSVYMSGRVPSGNEIHWSDGTVFVPEHNRTFLARVAADGIVRWVRPGTRSGESYWPDAIHTVVAQGAHVWTNEGAVRGGFVTGSRWGNFGGILINRFSENGDSLQATYLAGPVDDLYDAPGYFLGLGEDDDGNMYAAGHYIDTLRLNPMHVLVPRERGLNQYVFLAAYSPEGSVRWVHGMAGSSGGLRGNDSDRINGYIWPAKPAFDVDAQGNTYLGGFFRKGTVFAAGQPDSVRLEKSGAIVVSYDRAGQLRWLRTGSELGVEADWPSLRPNRMAVPWSLAVSDDGELVLQWSVPYDRRGIHVTVGDTAFWEGSGSNGIFELITRHAPDGSLRWVRRLTASESVDLTEIAMDRQGHVYVGGSYWGHQVQIEDTVLTNGSALGPITQTGLLVHYDAEGDVARTLLVTGPRYSMVSGIAPMPGGELYVAGFALEDRRGPDQIILGVDTLAIRPGRSKAFLAKYGPLTTARESNHERPVNRLQIAHYPNPFARAATIAYELQNTSHVVLRIYDILGRELAVLVDERQSAGSHSAMLDASAWPSGIYLYRLEAGNQVATGRLVRRK
ncbi:MAG: T9SS type A sorting domain-containing protein [Acidobacteriia bacterium]|nr:T9SS type A sorting domain-containing protein [Terriglobia bacterium]